MAKVPQEYIDMLRTLVAFKTISTDPEFKPEIHKAVEWLKQLLKEHGFEVTLARAGASNPTIIASITVSEDFERVLVYGHYDVQPAAQSDGWDSDPFVLTEKKGRLIARGAIDNKGQIMTHLYTVFKLLKANMLGYNVTFIIEGDEETGSSEMLTILKENKALLKADHILISDGETAANLPCLEHSFRGIVNMKVTYQTADTNVHSGLYGGAIPNAAHELSQLIASFHDKHNVVIIPGFHKGIEAVDPSERRDNKRLAKLLDLDKSIGVKMLRCEKGNDFFTQVGRRASLEITGFKSGYIGEGYCNIVPSHAEARINIRLAPSQDPKEIFATVKKFIEKKTPSYVTVKIEAAKEMVPASKLDVTTPKAMEIRAILKRSHGSEPVIKSVGGSIPIVADFKKVFGTDPILVSLANEDCNMHGIHENYDMTMAAKGLKFSELFFGRK